MHNSVTNSFAINYTLRIICTTSLCTHVPGKGPPWGPCAQPGWASLPKKEDMKKVSMSIDDAKPYWLEN